MTVLTISNGQVTFTCDNVVAAPEHVHSLLAQVNLPGVEGGDAQYLGSLPRQFTVQGVLCGSTAKDDLDKLRSLRTSVCDVTLEAFGKTWLSGSYFIARLTWTLVGGTANASDAAVLQFIIDFVEVKT